MTDSDATPAPQSTSGRDQQRENW